MGILSAHDLLTLLRPVAVDAFFEQSQQRLRADCLRWGQFRTSVRHATLFAVGVVTTSLIDGSLFSRHRYLRDADG